MKQKLQVFISSTYTDLIEERQAAVEAILGAGHISAGMELFRQKAHTLLTKLLPNDLEGENLWIRCQGI